MDTNPSPITPLTLVGRERELAVLRQHLDAALQGRGSLVLIGGEAGIGKTALAETLCRGAEGQGALVLVGRCYDLSETPPYGPWIDLFSRYRPHDGTPPLPAPFAHPGTIGTVTSQAALAHAVHAFFAALATHSPLILLLDDLHWSDPASLDLLRLLARATPDLPLLILGTYRSDELTRHHPFSPLVPLLVRESAVQRLTLAPLDPVAVHRLVVARYGLTDNAATVLVDYLQTRAEGNALFLDELLRSLEETGALVQHGDAWQVGLLTPTLVPPLLRQVIESRLGRLDAESQRLLVVAAMIGHTIPLAVWARVGEVDEEQLLAVIEQGLEMRLLVEAADSTAVRFAHALIREAVYTSVPAVRRRRFHLRVAEALADSDSPDPDAVAYQFQQAGDERALSWLLKAGERAQAAYAWVTAAGRYEAALALMERRGEDAAQRGWLLVRLTRLLNYVDVPRARALASQALGLGEAAGDRALLAFARFQRGMLACLSGDVVSGMPEMEPGAEALARLTDAERAKVAEFGELYHVFDYRGTVVGWRAYIGHYQGARALGERLLAEAAGDEAVLLEVREAMMGLGHTYAAQGLPDEAAAMFTRAHECYLRVGHHPMAAAASFSELDLVALPYRTEDIAGRRRLADRAEAEGAPAMRALPTSAPPRARRLPLLILEGHWDEAERLAMAMSAEEQARFRYRATAHWHLATLAWLRGEAERAWRSVQVLLPAGSATEPGTVSFFAFVLPTQRVAAALALDEQDHTAARAWLEAHDRWLDWSGAVLGRSEGAAMWAQYHLQAEDREQAHTHAERALAHATAPRQPLALLAAHRLLGELLTEAERYEEAATHLAESLHLAEACAAPYERALTLLARAALDLALARLDDARRDLQAVREICEPLRAQPALARADVLLTRLDSTATITPAFPAGLSAREVDVLRLVAGGMTDRQIADHLFLSPRTVSHHLRSIYNKLAVANRAAATQFAVAHGIA